MEDSLSNRKPHQSALRKGRVSRPGATYFITTIVHSTFRRFGLRPLLRPGAASIIIDTINWLRDHDRIWCLGYVVMDDHIHLMFLLREPYTLSQVMHSLKRHTARRINQLLETEGKFWQAAYHDHMIRDERDFRNHLRYLHANPVEREFVKRPEDYFFSTAHPERAGDIDWNAVGWNTF